ncbi:MAG: hypothetical protein ACRD4O_13120, partial [Bryobacteraceae bacterium]
MLVHKASPLKKQKLPEFWSSFFGNGLSTRMVLPTPIFYGYRYHTSTLTPFATYMSRLEFDLIDHETVVLDRSTAHEHTIFSLVPEAEGRSIWPGVIAVIPARNPHVHLLIMAGRYTSALVTLLTSSNGLNQLQQMWHANKSPQFFQMVVEADMDGNQ